MKRNEILDTFGQILISEVRDEALEEFQMTLQGTMKSAAALDLYQKLRSFNDEELSIIREVVLSSIDDVLHNFLWMLEQNEDDLELYCGDGKGSTKRNINELSDGLAGELYTEDGWIARFSKFKEDC